MRTRFINAFTLPIRRALDASGLTYEILGGPRAFTASGCKMQKQRVSFEEVYDVFAIRIIIDSPIDREKPTPGGPIALYPTSTSPIPIGCATGSACPKPTAMKVSTPPSCPPQANGWKCKSDPSAWMRLQRRGWPRIGATNTNDTPDAARNASDNLNTWLTQIREMLESGEEDALDFIDEFKLNLHSEEIYVFTPNGDLFSLPKGATTLDFAFRVHTQIGSRCIGAKVNHKLVPSPIRSTAVIRWKSSHRASRSPRRIGSAM